MKHARIITAVALVALGCSKDNQSPGDEEAPKAAEPATAEPEPEPEPEVPPEVAAKIAALDAVAASPQEAEKIIPSFAGLGAPAVAPLVAKIEAGEAPENLVYVMALARVGEPAVEPLGKYLDDSELSWAHVDVCEGLARVGPAAKPARDAVARRAEEGPAGVAKACAAALKAIDK